MRTCNLDNGDCGFWVSLEGNNCNQETIADDICDEEWVSRYCNFDNMACGGEFCDSSQTWYTIMIDNNVCDEDWAIDADWNFDGEDCVWAPGCSFILRTNDQCDD